ncbi:MAG TPA: CRTAC1 family protein [Candidatus Limnocylindria bacterium]
MAGPASDRPFSRARLWLLVAVALAAILLAALLAGPFRADASRRNARGAPHFVEESSAAGLIHRYDGGFVHYTGGGMAAFDCDDDGRPELYLAGGSGRSTLFHNESEAGGALHFTPFESAALDVPDVIGAYPVDIDSDGFADLVLLRAGENIILRGLGDCRFERANEQLGFDGGDAWSTSFSATWDGDARLPTLAVGNYLDQVAYAANEYRCEDNQLFRPAAGGSSYDDPITLTPGYCALSMLFTDWDGSGRADLRVSNDRQYYRDGEEQLWRVEAGKAPRLYTAEDGWQPLRIWGMGIAAHDLTGDGLPEYYLTSQADNKLQTLADGAAQPLYEDMALAAGVTAHRPYDGDTSLPSTAWHAEFADVNNDGYIDLFVAKGNVEAQEGYAIRDPSNLLLGRADGTFTEAAPEAGIVSFRSARGAALVDLNLDGLLDLVVVNRRENVGLWRNLGSGSGGVAEPMGGWLALRLQQDGINRDAIGALVEVRVGDDVERREVTVGGGHASGELGWLHFGIGDAVRATVSVRWPDGEQGAEMEMTADTFGIVRRSASGVEGWTP